MALKEVPSTFSRLVLRGARPSAQTLSHNGRRAASNAAEPAQEQSEDFQDLESQSSFLTGKPSAKEVKSYDPIKRAEARRTQLPRSRYQYRPPRYFRGPLHPHQPPPTSDPASRLFVPGPFSTPRLVETYQSTVAADLMTLAYSHTPPGTVKEPRADRLRSWDDSSPYMKNRPKRGPRGGDTLRLLEKDINWRTIPKIKEVTVHCMVKEAAGNSAPLHVAGMMLQAITGVRPEVHRVKETVQNFGIRADMPISLTCTMRGDDAWQFVDKCVNLVLPRIKDWPGVNGSSGDNSGNIAWGIDKHSTNLFPEVEVNYDMYPPNYIPGFHVICKTTATSDRHARLLLKALGVPFHGKYVN
ncbi:hypothetical protein VC83_07842 [Pseudogymnoascus destructans]|uniref:Large ribosomal subunit protein uL5m n=2 Tax=Pseudogymnoascus destructans TaxID=655981 RepID=L8FR92_PSED2|nr:uncharacterized protein VC83_07842 [Pseudogymnoascus destructans]ELR02206.1 hypothetical protein GMDG_00999 [Pseudogymnoascus destructans 20631-21]OAF55739.1 hypothetical protein VC83_07842 [Pseudogymnoascus destructans]